MVDAELRHMLRAPDDSRSAVVAVLHGAGGTESNDWAQMLVRMYQRWAERNGFRSQVLDWYEGDDAVGISRATLEITGAYVYGCLKGEHGVHRLVRVSPFDPAGRRHVAFASVSVHPASDDVDGDGDGAHPEQIRTYVLHPYTLAEDHRTGHRLEDVQAVLDGGLEPFIRAYLREYGK